MNQKTLSILHLAGDILSDPANRCTGTLAEDNQRSPVWPEDPSACRWCLNGALRLAMHKIGTDGPAEDMEIYQSMKSLIGLDPKEAAYIIWDYTNSTVQDNIVKLMREAK